MEFDVDSGKGELLGDISWGVIAVEGGICGSLLEVLEGGESIFPRRRGSMVLSISIRMEFDVDSGKGELLGDISWGVIAVEGGICGSLLEVLKSDSMLSVKSPLSPGPWMSSNI
jgi:hypothetical protein